MSELKRIADEHRRAFNGDAWHGPSLMKLLRGVNAAQAAAKPVFNAHNILEIVLHLITWNKVVARRVAGTEVKVSAAEDWPPIQKITDADWSKTLEDLEQSHQSLIAAIETTANQSGDDALGRIVPGKDHSNYILLHGAVQHLTYHAGQIAILKKSLA